MAANTRSPCRKIRYVRLNRRQPAVSIDDLALMLEEIGHGHFMHLGQAVQGKNRHQQRESDQERQVQPELGPVATKQDGLTPDQGKKLAQAAGRRSGIQ